MVDCHLGNILIRIKFPLNNVNDNVNPVESNHTPSRVKSGNFGHHVNSDSDFFASYFNYWNKKINELSKQ